MKWWAAKRHGCVNGTDDQVEARGREFRKSHFLSKTKSNGGKPRVVNTFGKHGKARQQKELRHLGVAGVAGTRKRGRRRRRRCRDVRCGTSRWKRTVRPSKKARNAPPENRLSGGCLGGWTCVG
ncbi:hypothetical protein TRVL_05375 [Trypanosoma vivax]|nr:hypothetical protein TRVL_05375 [Trypanosoma vivax]